MFGDTGDGCGQCGIFGILGVLGDGSYALCGIGETVPDLVFGHAARDRLEDVWNGNPVLQELREGLPSRLQGICGECLMKRVCLGNCVAQNFYRSKSLWAPNWYCEEAAKRGSFPEIPGSLQDGNTTGTCEGGLALMEDSRPQYSKPLIVDLDDPNRIGTPQDYAIQPEVGMWVVAKAEPLQGVVAMQRVIQPSGTVTRVTGPTAGAARQTLRSSAERLKQACNNFACPLVESCSRIY